MKNTNIQWCHSTINPVMGCDGCELWRANNKCAGKALQAMLVRRVFFLVGRCSGATVGAMQAKLG